MSTAMPDAGLFIPDLPSLWETAAPCKWVGLVELQPPLLSAGREVGGLGMAQQESSSENG